MSSTTSYLRRDPGRSEALGRDVRTDPLPGRSGRWARRAEVHQVEIDNAKLHYHAHTDEFYYVIDGTGSMVLDDEVIELHKGVVVYVPRGREAQGHRQAHRAHRLHSAGRLVGHSRARIAADRLHKRVLTAANGLAATALAVAQ